MTLLSGIPATLGVLFAAVAATSIAFASASDNSWDGFARPLGGNGLTAYVKVRSLACFMHEGGGSRLVEDVC